MLAKLEKNSWRPYLDMMTKGLEGKTVEIEVDSLQIGAQIEVEWVPIFGISYDPKSDIMEVLLEGLDHMIHKPKELYVDHQAGGITSLEVIDEDDVRQIIKLHDPLLLPSSGGNLH